MNIAALLTFMVPKSAQGWPLIAVSAAGPCVVLSTAIAFSTVLKSPLEVGKDWSSATPTARWLGVLPPNDEKAFWASDKVRSTLCAVEASDGVRKAKLRVTDE